MGMPELNKYAASYKKALSENPDDSSLNSSIAMCYLKLSLYDQAAAAFSQAIAQDFDNSELYFYEAICILKGKKAFKALRPDIDKIEELLAAAISIEPRGIYYYLHAYIKYDYYERKRFKSTPSCQDLVEQAVSAGFHSNDAEQLFQILKVEIPSEMILSS
jgi:tetratricopeptide (TPR) repeat protein